MKICISGEAERMSKRYDEIQEQTLFQILRRNSRTEYGRKYNFREINSKEKFRKNVPLSDYSDYEEYIRRMVNEGAEKLIIDEDVDYYAVSSGSSGEPKYFPVPKLNILLLLKYAYFYSYEIIERYYGGCLNLRSSMKGRLFLMNEIRCHPMSGGKKRGIISGILFDFLRENGGLFMHRYTSPEEVLFPEDAGDMLYLRLRFALGCENVEGILGTFIYHLLFHMKYMENNWESLVDDIGRGTISDKADISDKVRDKLKKYISPMPERADFLSKEFLKGFDEPIVPRIWRNLKFTMGISGKTYGGYMRGLRRYTGDIPHHCFIYSSSEGIITACASMGDEGEYILVPDCGYYEFLDEKGNLTDKGDLREGGKYELVFTGNSGLYRYRMKDVIEIVGFYNEIPVFNFSHRTESMVNIAGEKTLLSVLTRAVENLKNRYKIFTGEFGVYPDEGGVAGRYVFLMEIREEMHGIPAEELSDAMDRELRRQSFDYDDCRSRGEIDRARVRLVKRGAFGEYTNMLRNNGVDTGQLKPVRLLNTEGKRGFFNDRIIL